MRPYVLQWLAWRLPGRLAAFLAPSWFTCVGLAGLAALVLMLVLARRRGVDPGTAAAVVLWCHVAAVVAGIVVPMMIDGVERLVATGHFHLRWAGMTSFWGYLAGMGAAWLVCKRDGVPLARVGDLAVVPLGVALAFARLGCFLAGCDYGKVSWVPWAVRFPAGSPAWRDHVRAGLIAVDRPTSLPVHPTQLYEAGLGLAIVAIALWASRRPRRDGQLFVLAAATYAIGRLMIETLRGDAARGIHAGVSSGQIFSLLVLVAIVAHRVLAKRRAMTTIAAVAVLALAIAPVGAVDAQPALQPPGAQPPTDPPPTDLLPSSPAPGLAERPLLSTGVLVGVATPLNRRAHQVPTLAGPSISLGYLPGRFGAWLDLDSYASTEATHGTLLISGSFTQRLTRALAVGGRFGLGVTEVNFKAPAFRDVGGTTIRFEAIVEYALARHWALWIRPLSIDVLSASELGGPIATYQFRLGVAYRFGSRRNALPAPPPPPSVPPPPPYPQLSDPDPVAAQDPAPAPDPAEAARRSP